MRKSTTNNHEKLLHIASISIGVDGKLWIIISPYFVELCIAYTKTKYSHTIYDYNKLHFPMVVFGALFTLLNSL